LPVANRGAVERAIRFGLAVGASIAPVSIFARKNYFYPDLPKGYQISQYETPVVQGGSVEIRVGEETRHVRLTRAHLEEDAGKSMHEGVDDTGVDTGAYRGGWSGIDLNRAGTPLLEIVSEPDMRSSAEAVAYARALHALVVWLGICDGNMQEGASAATPTSRCAPRRARSARARDQEPEQLPLHAAGDRLRGAVADRPLEDGGEVRRPRCSSTPSTARRGPCAPRKTRTTTATSRTRTCRRWRSSPAWIASVRAEMPSCRATWRARFQSEYGSSAYDARIMEQSRDVAATSSPRARPAAAEAGRQLGHGRDLEAAAWPAADDDSDARRDARALVDAHRRRTISKRGGAPGVERLWLGEATAVDAVIERAACARCATPASSSGSSPR
jgi:aspartyl-tRNA(Asn)/glutamyl-tRNA(Gln) amidotransferase subunit B